MRVTVAAVAIAVVAATIPVIAQRPEITVAAGEVLRGRFVQERALAGFDAPLRSEGRFAFSTERGLIWRTEKPFSIVTAISSAGLTQLSGGTEVLRLPATRMPALARMFDLIRGALVGDWRALEEYFSVRRHPDGDGWRVTLVPRTTSAAPFESVEIAGGRFAERIEIRKPGGDVDRLRFSGQAISSVPFTPDELALLGGPGR